MILPRRDLKSAKQVADWLADIGSQLKATGNLILIGSAALPWNAHNLGLVGELPEASMDVYPVTDSDEVAMHGYEALIGGEFERTHGSSSRRSPPFLARFFERRLLLTTKRVRGN